MKRVLLALLLIAVLLLPTTGCWLFSQEEVAVGANETDVGRLTIVGHDGVIARLDEDTQTLYLSSNATGGCADAFGVIDADAGSDPIANACNDTLAFTSADLVITGDTTTDTITFSYGNDSVDDIHINWGNGTAQVSAVDVPIEFLLGATYTSVQDWLDSTQSAGRLSGGNFTANANGTLKVAAGTGIIKTSDSYNASGDTLSIDWAQHNAISLTNNTKNTIYVDYNGGSPIVKSTTTPSADINHTTTFTLGTIYREDNTLHMLSGGTNVYNLVRRVHHRAREIRGIERSSGMMTSETGTRRLYVTAGVAYAGLNRFTTNLYNGNITNFYYWYNDGAWQKNTAANTIDNLQYNDYGVGLAALGNNKYGLHWVFIDYDSHVHVVYGVGNYLLAEALDASIPVNTPTLVSDFSIPIAKILIQRNDAAFTSIETPFEIPFTSSIVQDHNDLGGIQGGIADQYYHLSLAERNFAIDPDHIDDNDDDTSVICHSNDTVSMDVAGIDAFVMTDVGIINTPSQSTFYAYKSATQNIPSAAMTKVVWEVEYWDTQNEMNLTNDRFTATEDGRYMVNANLDIYTMAVGDNIRCSVYVNGALARQYWIWAAKAASQILQTTSILELDAYDFVEIWIYHNNAGVKVLHGGSNGVFVWFTMHKQS